MQPYGTRVCRAIVSFGFTNKGLSTLTNGVPSGIQCYLPVRSSPIWAGCHAGKIAMHWSAPHEVVSSTASEGTPLEPTPRLGTVGTGIVTQHFLNVVVECR